MPSGDPKDEHHSLGDNIRWYSNIRFAQLTLFVAFNAVLINRLFSADANISGNYALTMKVAGVLSALVFGYMEFRADEHWSHFVKRAEDLEAELGSLQYTDRPKRRLRTTHVLPLFFAAVFCFWLLTIFVR